MNVADTPPRDEAEKPSSRSAEQRESHVRSVLKAFSWRIVATSTTGIIAYIVTGTIWTALQIGGIEFVIKFLVYYLHERAWQLVPRGTIRAFVRRN